MRASLVALGVTVEAAASLRRLDVLEDAPQVNGLRQRVSEGVGV